MPTHTDLKKQDFIFMLNVINSLESPTVNILPRAHENPDLLDSNLNKLI